MSQKAEILIVDDMPSHITFSGTILQHAGYKVWAATSGERALQLLKKQIPDMIILDINMKGMSGIEVCKILKEQEETKEIPIIFVTTENSAGLIAQGFKAGCCDYVVKPFGKEEYLARIHTHLSLSRQTRELASAYEELDLFCSAVSHDLKAPLNVINMLIEMLREELGEGHEEVQKITTLMSRKSHQAVQMIERLLEFSRMCHITPYIKALDIKQIIRESFEEQHLLEPHRQIQLHIGELPKVEGDQVLITMLMKNIMTNAFKFTRHKMSADITITSAKQGAYKVIQIQDNGAGFEEAYADKLFTIFERLHDEETFEGSGVGLAMVDRIMRRHGGKVRMEGIVDKGASVFLYFQSEMNTYNIEGTPTSRK